ncbi:MAG TPA: TetR/AcrR family transcriptional regulator [Clostridia bacterium]|nr:TetR/AcrR family transcriptional regulator [Clostridia bacterium]
MDKSLLHRKEAIIVTSIEVINDYGIQGLSTREVANRQGISEGTIFKHFRTKNELILAILDHYSQYDVDIVESIKLKKLKPKAAIIYFINAFAGYYQNYPQITAITQTYDVLSHDPKLEDKIKGIFMNRYGFFEATIAEGQKTGEITQSIDSEKLAGIIWGSFSTACLRWRLSGYNFPLKDYILTTIETVLKAFSL